MRFQTYLDLLTQFAVTPTRFLGRLGLFALLIGGVSALYILYHWIVRAEPVSSILIFFSIAVAMISPTCFIAAFVVVATFINIDVHDDRD